MKILHIVGVIVACLFIQACSPKTETSYTEQDFANAPISLAQAEQIFDYAYPQVIMKISQDVMQTVPFRQKVGLNHFIHFDHLAGPKQRAVVLANRNTLYSVGWVDLSQGPVIFETPDMGDRYYVMPLLDAWSNTFRSLGSRTTGQGAQKYVIVRAGWDGDLPHGYEVIISPTDMVWITGRIQADSAEDAVLAAELQDEYRLMTYQEFKGEGDPFVDYKPAFKALSVRRPVPYSLKMSAEDFYDTFFAMWANNPSPEADRGFLDMMGVLPDQGGGGPVTRFSDLAPDVQKVLTAGLKAKQAAYRKAFYEGTEQTEPWIFNLDPRMGNWGTEFSRRAYWCMWGLGTNIVEDAVYGVTQLDQDLIALNGANIYRIHFAPGETPPTEAFWSVTTYDAEGYLEENGLDRYDLGSNHTLRYNIDGSLDFFLSHTPPSDTKLNWVPAPKGDFKILLRVYWPDEAILDGGWALPPIEKVTSFAQDMPQDTIYFDQQEKRWRDDTGICHSCTPENGFGEDGKLLAQ